MKKIIILDDDQDFLEICVEILGKYEFETYATNDVNIITDLIEKVKPDLILLDWQMPGKDGIVLSMELKQQPGYKDIPVIIMSGVRTISEDLAIAFESGAIDYITKPFNEIELVSRIKSVIKNYKTNIDEYKFDLEKYKYLYSEVLSENDQKDKKLLISNNIYFRNNYILSLIKKELTVLLSSSTTLSKIEKLIDKLKLQNKIIENSYSEEVFYQTESDFIKKLRTVHPDLSDYEIKICSFFKMGYSTKEIATVTYTNYEAVRKAVYRIRKKLLLINNRKSITAYLNSL
ncbi:MAG: two component transcriptional regulator, LuxR family protein [Bacteroidetes bacterium]|jgi:DNA-binding response OmpR family regulator|nr:two component transcriptional regulator, LuxR family protein [Bacteroidota bacterium]